MKRQVFELLSALCVYNAEGYSRALEALDHYKVSDRKMTMCAYNATFVCWFFTFMISRTSSHAATDSASSLKNYARQRPASTGESCGDNHK